MHLTYTKRGTKIYLSLCSFSNSAVPDIPKCAIAGDSLWDYKENLFLNKVCFWINFSKVQAAAQCAQLRQRERWMCEMVADMVITYLFAFFWYVQPQWCWSCGSGGCGVTTCRASFPPARFPAHVTGNCFLKKQPTFTGCLPVGAFAMKSPFPQVFLV